jgi:hypothetical protein
MDWIKKNVGFVAGLGGAVLSLGGAVFYLLQFGTARDDAKAALDQKNQELDALVKRPVYPNKSNIDAARKEQETVARFIVGARSRFGPLEEVKAMNNGTFKSLLESTIGQLEREASQAGVKLPAANYSFTFAEQRKQLQLAASSLPAFSRELSDIEAICGILFSAKIHSLTGLKRYGVGTNEGFANPDIMAGKKPGTNDMVGASIFGYEAIFQCFSAELGEVIEGFVKSTNCYLVKTINVEPGSGSAPDLTAASAAPISFGSGMGGMDPVLAARYGLAGRSRYGASQPQMPVAQPTAAPKANEPAVEEKPLKVTLGLEVVKLASPVQEGQRKSPPKTETAVQ